MRSFPGTDVTHTHARCRHNRPHVTMHPSVFRHSARWGRGIKKKGRKKRVAGTGEHGGAARAAFQPTALAGLASPLNRCRATSFSSAESSQSSGGDWRKGKGGANVRRYSRRDESCLRDRSFSTERQLQRAIRGATRSSRRTAHRIPAFCKNLSASLVSANLSREFAIRLRTTPQISAGTIVNLQQRAPIFVVAYLWHRVAPLVLALDTGGERLSIGIRIPLPEL